MVAICIYTALVKAQVYYESSAYARRVLPKILSELQSELLVRASYI